MKSIPEQIKKEVRHQLDMLQKVATDQEKERGQKELSLKRREREIETEERAVEFQKTFNTTVIGAFTFVAGLMWRDVANSIIGFFLPDNEGFATSLVMAFLVTLVIVIFAVNLNIKVKKKEESLKKRKERLDKDKIELE